MGWCGRTKTRSSAGPEDGVVAGGVPTLLIEIESRIELNEELLRSKEEYVELLKSFQEQDRKSDKLYAPTKPFKASWFDVLFAGREALAAQQADLSMRQTIASSARQREAERIQRDAEIDQEKREIARLRRLVAQDRDLLSHGERISVYRLYWKDASRDFDAAAYETFSEVQRDSPVLLAVGEGRQLWWHLDRFWWEGEGLSADDVQALILQKDRRKEATLARAHAEVRGEGARLVRREPIPEAVRHEVWRRDGGCCVDCGSRENLEFDHIIPVSLGGSNTARNIELRCESCNRKKGATI